MKQPEEKIASNESALTMTIVRNKEVGVANYIPIIGGDDSNPTWEEYINGFEPELTPHLELVRKGIELNGMIGEKAYRVCNNTSFSFSDGKVIGFSWRAWGDLMQAIIGKREGYMQYYM